MATGLLDTSGGFILVAAFGLSLVLQARKGEDALLPLEQLILGFICLTFYRDGLAIVAALGDSLHEFILRASKSTPPLRDLLWQATEPPKGTSARGLSLRENLASAAEAFGFGIWAIARGIADLVFILAELIIKAARDCLREVLTLLFPIGIGLIPVYPKIALSLALLGIELTLWLPILRIIDFATSRVAKAYIDGSNSDRAFLIFGIELVSILLTLSIPVIAHRFVSGNLSGAIFDSWKSPISLLHRSGQRTGKVYSYFNKSRKTAAALIAFTLINPTPLIAANESIQLYRGFITKIKCDGKLIASSIGDDRLVELEPLPGELGCAVLLRPKLDSGTTNLILETSTGSELRILQVSTSKSTPSLKSLEISLRSRD